MGEVLTLTILSQAEGFDWSH